MVNERNLFGGHAHVILLRPKQFILFCSGLGQPHKTVKGPNLGKFVGMNTGELSDEIELRKTTTLQPTALYFLGSEGRGPQSHAGSSPISSLGVWGCMLQSRGAASSPQRSKKFRWRAEAK